MRLAEAEAGKPFDLKYDLMLRVTPSCSRKRSMWCCSRSITLLPTAGLWNPGARVQRALWRLQRGEKNPLSPLPLQYADYARWQRDWLQGEVLERGLLFWKTQLAGVPPVHALPLDKARPEKQGFSGATHLHWLDEALTARLKRLCQRENTTLFMLLQTAFALLVSRYSHEPDVVIGTPIAGRLREEIEPLIGFFINNLALRSRFDANIAFRTVLRQQKQTILDAYAHQNIPFEMLVEHLNPERNTQHDPLFQIVFSLDNLVSEPLSLQI